MELVGLVCVTIVRRVQEVIIVSILKTFLKMFI